MHLVEPPTIGGASIRRAREHLLRLLLFTALENHELTNRFFRTHVAQYLEMLAEYVRAGIAEGRFRPVDPLLAARGLVGMLSYHFQIQELFGGKHLQDFDPRHVSRTLVDLWLQGMHADKQPSSAQVEAGNLAPMHDRNSTTPGGAEKKKHS